MNINRQRPNRGEDLALFLSQVINDAMRDATEAGLANAEAVRIAFSLAQGWQMNGPPATERHSTPCVTRLVGGGRDELIMARPVCVYLRDGTKVAVGRDPETKGRAWLEVVTRVLGQAATPTTEQEAHNA